MSKRQDFILVEENSDKTSNVKKVSQVNADLAYIRDIFALKLSTRMLGNTFVQLILIILPLF